MIIYANNGGKWDAINKIFNQDPNVKPYEEYVSEWYNLGARIIGGCCQIRPDVITKVKNVLESL